MGVAALKPMHKKCPVVCLKGNRYVDTMSCCLPNCYFSYAYFVFSYAYFWPACKRFSKRLFGNICLQATTSQQIAKRGSGGLRPTRPAEKFCTLRSVGRHLLGIALWVVFSSHQIHVQIIVGEWPHYKAVVCGVYDV